MLNEELFLISIHYICESLTVKNGLYHELEIIYEKDKFKYYKAARENCLFTDSYITNGSLEREIRLKQILGVLLVAEEDESLRFLIQKTLSKYYPDLSEIIKKRPSELISFLQSKTITKDWMANNSFSRISYYFLRLYFGFEETDNNDFAKFIELMENNFKRLNEWKPLKRVEDDRFINPTFMPFIKKYEHLFENYKRCSDFLLLLDKAEGKNNTKNVTKFGIGTLGIQRDILMKMNFIGTLFDVQELSTTLLTNHITLSKNEIRQIFITIILICGEKIENVEALPEIQIIQYYVFGIYFQTLLKEYKNAKELYRRNDQEAQYLEYERLRREITNLNLAKENLENRLRKFADENQNLINDRDKIKSEIEKAHYSTLNQLEKENEKYRTELSIKETNEFELQRLREYVFSLEQTSESNDVEIENITLPVDKKVIIIGGHDKWRKKLVEKFKFLTVIDGTNQNIDPDIIKKADLVLFFTPHMSHATYFKFIAYLNRNRISYSYVNETNLDLFEIQLRTEIMKIIHKN